MVTYRQVGDFLVARVNQELESATENPAIFFKNLDQTDSSNNGVPPGTYAEFRNEYGRVVANTPPLGNQMPPKLPSGAVAGGIDFTLSRPHYKVATVDKSADTREGPVQGTLIVAIPMRDVDDTLHHLLLI